MQLRQWSAGAEGWCGAADKAQAVLGLPLSTFNLTPCVVDLALRAMSCQAALGLCEAPVLAQLISSWLRRLKAAAAWAVASREADDCASEACERALRAGRAEAMARRLPSGSW